MLLISVSVSFLAIFAILGPFVVGPIQGAISDSSQQFSLDDNRRKKARRACAVRA